MSPFTIALLFIEMSCHITISHSPLSKLSALKPSMGEGQDGGVIARLFANFYVELMLLNNKPGVQGAGRFYVLEDYNHIARGNADEI